MSVRIAVPVTLAVAVLLLASGCLKGGQSATGGQLEPEGGRGIAQDLITIKAGGPDSPNHVTKVGRLVGFKNMEPQSELMITSASNNWELSVTLVVPGVAVYTFKSPGTYKYKVEWIKSPKPAKSFEATVTVE